VFVVLHLPEGSTSVLPEIISNVGPLPASAARDGARFEPGTIVVAPPDRHLLVAPGRRTRVVRGPKVNGSQPSVDVLFNSAASAYGSCVVGVVLTGSLSDGALGLQAIKCRGGGAIAQSDAMHQGMPSSAVRRGDVDYVVPLLEIPNALTMLMTTRGETQVTNGGPEGDLETGFDLTSPREARGDPSGLTCPECGGPLWERDEGARRRFSCHVGHTFSAESLVEEHGEYVEHALWTAVRILEERRALVLRLAERMESGGQQRSARRFSEQAREAGAQADAIRGLFERPARSPEAAVVERGRAA
jgi:two-component system chemotaxis response regulator CheB